MTALDKKRIKQNETDENIEIDSETVKIVKIPNSKLLKAYYWKKENETFLAIGQIGIERKTGDQTRELQEEYKELKSDQIIKIIAAMIEVQSKK